MSADEKKAPAFVPPVSAFAGPVAELIALRMLQPPPRPGILATLDQYEILRLLGTGGMGIVLLARETATGREVAIKMVKSELVSNQEVVHRFLREAGHLKRLRHANVVPVETISERAEGPYFVMPYFEKSSLAHRIKPGIPLETQNILDLATQVAGGLSFAHRSGIIHRDLKPANILIAGSGRACLADFGLARSLFNDTMVDVESRNLEGTAPYMSPAVAAGDAEDTRCDIYSFGAVLYEMLTGYPPYQGRGTRDILDQVLAGSPRPIPSLNPDADRGLVAVAEACMARELRDRYADMRDVLKDLERIRLNQQLTGRRRFRRVMVARLTRPAMTFSVIVLCLLVATVASWVFWSGRVHKPKPAPVVVPVAVPAPPKIVAPAPPPVWSVTTFAGQPQLGGYADGPGNQAKFRLPNSLAVDAAGNIYVADTANDMIRKIDTNGTVSTVAGVAHSHGSKDGPGSSARFWAPFGIALDATGAIYVADTGNNTIRKISTNGVVTTLAGSAGHPGSKDGTGTAARFRNPWGVAVGSDGDVYVADMSNDTIRKIKPDGSVVTVAGQAETTGSIDGFATDAQFNNPFAIALDAADNIYVVDSANSLIRKITRSRIVSTFAGLPGNLGNTDASGAAARFWNPQGIAVDGSGNIYVADTGNNTIRKITPMAQVTTLAGAAGVTGSDDGLAQSARFNGPAGVAVDRAGNVYVADTNNHAIRKIALTSPSSP